MIRCARFAALALLCVLAACSKSRSKTPPAGPIDTKTFVAGKVVDADGNPIPGAKIQVVGSDLGSGETDANGVFSIKLLALPASGEASVKVTAPGYTLSQRRFPVISGGTASVEVAVKQIEVKVDQMVTALSPPINVTTPDEAVQITIPSPSTTLGTTGNVSVEVTAGNPKVERGVFPGDFNATDPVAPAQTTGLSSIAFVEVKVTNTDTGAQVSDLTGSATLTVKIPEGTINPATGLPFAIGDQVPVWSFEETTGLWKRGKSAAGADLFGNVIANPDGSLSGVFPIPHFSWWNMDYPLDNRHALKGRVVDSSGSPVGNAAVTAFGVDQNYEFGANTRSDGTFSFDVFRGTVCRIQAKVGARLSNVITVNVPDVQSSTRFAESPTNVLTSVGSLQIADGTCVGGFVRNVAGQPIVNALVEVLGRNRFDNTDALGEYCVEGLDPSSAVTIRVTTSVQGLPVSREIVVTTGATPGRCVDNTCMRQDIVVDTDLAGVAGRVTRLSDGAPLANVNVWTDQGPFVRTGADGRYQLPARKSTPVLVSVSFFDPSTSLTYTKSDTVLTGATTAVPGSPATCASLDVVLNIQNGCVQGIVLNELGVPVQGVNVYVSGFPVGSTDASGAYMIDAPIRSAVPVFFTKYVSNGRFVTHTAFVDVTQPEPVCASLNVTLQFQLACVQGTVLINGQLAPGVTVSTPNGIATATDAFGTYCFDIVRNQDLTLRFFKTLASGQTLWHEQTFTVASFPGLSNPGSCATGNCTDLGTITLNRIPAITSITGLPATILSRGQSVVTVTASDPDGDTLSYFWNSPAGTFASPVVASTSWTAPLVLASTVFPLSVQISDGRGGLQSATVNVTVNPAPNVAPAISSLTPGSPSVVSSGSTSVTAAATDGDGDVVTYSWSSSGGTVVGSGAAVTWQAPSAPGTYTITVTASDGSASSSSAVSLTVTPVPNRAPVIAVLTASPATVRRGGVSTVSVNASDPDGNPMTFTWSAGGGASILGNGTTAAVTAPAAVGPFQVTVLVSDGTLSATTNVPITVVNNPPLISLLTATPSLIVGGQATTLTAAAGDPEGDALSYGYAQTAGPAAGAFSGTGPSRTWTAPASPGVYTLQLTVDDGLLTDVETVNVTVGNRPPQVASITATPGSVSRGGSTSLAVAATDPDGDSLTYAWLQIAGPAASTIATPTAATTGVTMPTTEGTYTFRVTATDNGTPNLNVQSTVNVVVGNRAPVISAMTATPATVALSGTSTIAVTAADPDGDPITYTYGATGGSIPGTTSSETWTAPAAPATYTITVTVSDGVLSTQQTVQVTVTPDTTPPAVSTASPVNAATNVALASTVALTFSEPVNPATVTAASFTVTSAGGPVGGTISFSAGNTVATFTPSSPLTGTTTYTVTATTAVQDVNSNALVAPFTSTFTTLTVTPTISISDVTTLEGNAGSTNAVFNVTLSQATGATVTVTAQTADATATSGSDYTSTGPTVITFNAFETTKTFTVPVLGDAADESNETYVVNLTAPTNATILDAQGVGTITDDDGTPTLTISDVTVTEGNAGTVNAVVTVTLAPSSGQTVTVRADTADGSAAAPGDYTAVVNQTLTFNPGETTKTVTVVVNGDASFEANETFVVDLTNAVNATIGDAQATGTINNDDGTPSITIGDATTAETGTAGFTLTLSNPSQSTVTVQVDTANDTAAAPGDYTAVVAQTVTFNPGETSKPFSVTIAADALNEVDETYFVNLSNSSGATIADPQAVGTITNDDPVPTLSVADVAAIEGGALTFTVTLSAASGKTVTVTADTADGAATSPADYTAVAATVLSFAPGETTKNVVVNSAADALNEADETFFMNLTLPGNATISDAQGVGTINDNDPLPVLTINDVAIAEGNAGTSTLTFTISLSAVSGQTVTVTATTADGTATTADGDYVAAGPTVFTFSPGETAKTFPVTVNGDLSPEVSESFSAVLSAQGNATIADGTGIGTITNDDVPPISITSLSLYSGPVGAVVRVNGTNFDATPANNLVRFNGTSATVSAASTTSLLVTVPGGATSGAVTVQVGAPTSNPSDPFLVLSPPVVNGSLSVAKALAARRHEVPVVVESGTGRLKSSVFGIGQSRGGAVDRYLVFSGERINVYNAVDDSLVAGLNHSATGDEFGTSVAVSPDGQTAYCPLVGPIVANLASGHEIQLVQNLGTVPVLGPRIDLKVPDPAIQTALDVEVTPDGKKLLVLTDHPDPYASNGHLVVIDTTTNQVVSATLLPSGGGELATASSMTIHPSGSHAYIHATIEAAGNVFIADRLLVFDITASAFVGAGTITFPATERLETIVVRPNGQSGFLGKCGSAGVSFLTEIDLSNPAAPALGTSHSIGTYYDQGTDLDLALSPDGGILYVKGNAATPDEQLSGNLSNFLLKGFDVSGPAPVLFDECHIGLSDQFIPKAVKWHPKGDRFLAFVSGVVDPAAIIQQSALVHSFRFFPGGVTADLAPYRGGASGGPLAGGSLTVHCFDSVTSLPAPGVSVSLSDGATGAVLVSALTDAAGNAVFPGRTGRQNITAAAPGFINFTAFGVDAQNFKLPLFNASDGTNQPSIAAVVNGLGAGQVARLTVTVDETDDETFDANGQVKTIKFAANVGFAAGVSTDSGTSRRVRRQFARAAPGAGLIWNATVVAESDNHTISGTITYGSDLPNGFASGPYIRNDFDAVFSTSPLVAAINGAGGGLSFAAGNPVPYSTTYTAPLAGVGAFRWDVSADTDGFTVGAGADPRVTDQNAEYTARIVLAANPLTPLSNQDFTHLNAPFLLSIGGVAVSSAPMFVNSSTPVIVFRDTLTTAASAGAFITYVEQLKPGGRKGWVFLFDMFDTARVSAGQGSFRIPDLPAAAAAESFAAVSNRPVQVETQAFDMGAGFSYGAWEFGQDWFHTQYVRTSKVAKLYTQGVPIGAAGPTAVLQQSRFNHGVVVLDNDRILVAGGGQGFPPARNTGEIYTVSSNTVDWTRDTGTSAQTLMNKARNEVVAARLLDGRAILAGGNTGSGTNHSDADIFNPATGLWTLTTVPNMTVGRIGHAGVLLNDGRVLIVGGLTGSIGSETVVPELEIYDPATNNWTTSNSGGGANSLVARDVPRVTVLNPGGGSPTQVLVTGGMRPETGLLIANARIEPTACILTILDGLAPVIGPAIPMSTPRNGHADVRLANGDVLLFGGATEGSENAGFNRVATIDRFVFATQTFSLESGQLLLPRGDIAAALVNSGGVPKVLLAGGSESDGPTALFELYNPATGATDAVHFGANRHGARAVVVPRPGNPALDRVVILGGRQDETPVNTIETYDP
jgi:hypothetical protein